MTRILIAPQEFKGTLTAREAAEAIAVGVRRALPDAELDLLPMADGGPGTVAALVEATGGTYHEAGVHDPLGRPINARWGASGDGKTAFIEMAAASGLVLLTPRERDARRTTTAGAGELMLAALDAGYREILIGVGGSATNDGGAGMAAALGARLLDANGADLPSGGAALARLARVDVSGRDPRLAKTAVVVAADVTNALCGPEGASLVYGAQKGAGADDARALDAALSHYADVVRRDIGVDLTGVAGAGAAGGLAGGLVAFCGADIRPGYRVVADAAGLVERLRGADLVLTGEGQLDRQSGYGKVTSGVATDARSADTPVIAIAGRVSDEAATANFDKVFALTPDFAAADDAAANAADVLATAAEAAAAWEA